jgi:nicotinate-nucleotide adenylyltransferase
MRIALRIALFGTSADPPTVGHLEILRWLAQHYDQVAVWASDNPFKQHPVNLIHRNAMLDRLVADLAQDYPNIELCPQLSFPRTILTLSAAQERWPTGVFTLVVGSDLLAQLPSWYRSQELLQQVELLVVPRPGSPLGEAQLLPLRSLGARVQIAPLQGLPVSSTAYRERGSIEALPRSIQAYIDQQGLYSWHAVSVTQ